MAITITPEIAERLRRNLIFDNDNHEGVKGAINILFKDEDRDSIKELYSIVHALVTSDFIVGQEISLPDFSGRELESSPDPSIKEETQDPALGSPSLP